MARLASKTMSCDRSAVLSTTTHREWLHAMYSRSSAHDARSLVKLPSMVKGGKNGWCRPYLAFAWMSAREENGPDAFAAYSLAELKPANANVEMLGRSRCIPCRCAARTIAWRPLQMPVAESLW